jgi:hypothetical protein
MINSISWFVLIGLGGFSALLAWKGRFWTLGLISILWLILAVWAWSSATDLRHLDYALAWNGGDPKMIFSFLTVFFGLPIYIVGATLGCVFHFRNTNSPIHASDIGVTKE